MDQPTAHPKQREINYLIEELTNFHHKFMVPKRKEIISMILLLNTTFSFIKEK
jgi:hypothetical protein